MSKLISSCINIIGKITPLVFFLIFLMFSVILSIVEYIEAPQLRSTSTAIAALMLLLMWLVWPLATHIYNIHSKGSTYPARKLAINFGLAVSIIVLAIASVIFGKEPGALDLAFFLLLFLYFAKLSWEIAIEYKRSSRFGFFLKTFVLIYFLPVGCFFLFPVEGALSAESDLRQ